MKCTLREYLVSNLARAVIDHRMRAQRDDEGRVSFYIHPMGCDGDTPTYRVDGNQLVQVQTGTTAPTEHELQLKGMPAPRVTPQQVEDQIESEHYHVPPGTTLTLCVLTLANGFTVTGESACASPANFDADIGRRYAREDAKRKIWALEGYALRNRLVQAGAC